MLRQFENIRQRGARPARFLALALVICGTAVLLTACGGGGGSRPSSGGPTMTITPSTNMKIPMAAGEVVNLEVLTNGAHQTHEFDASGIPSLDTGSPTRTYTARSSDTNVATVSVSGSMVMVSPRSKGTATVTIEAKSPPVSVGSAGVVAASHGGEHRMFSYMVRMPNRKPTTSGTISAVTLTEVGSTDTKDVSSHFTDPDGDTLSYTATSSDSGVVTTSVSGSEVTVTAVRAGSVTITVRARDNDPNNPLTSMQTFSVTVSSGAAGFAPVNQAAFDTLVVGKRAMSSGVSYSDFISPGRFREFDDGATYTGRYTYERTGPNTGRLVSFYDDGDRCTNTLTFTSATMGTVSYTCTDGDSGSGSWRLVDISVMPPVGDFAPANQAAFDTLVVGKRNSSSTGYLDFVSPGRFRSFDEGETDTGRYTWQRTETNKGRLTLVSDTNYRCTLTLTFTAATMGTYSYTCTDGDSGSGSWRLVDIPASPPPTAGFAPADQAAFDALVVGKRILGPVPAANYYLDFVSPGRFREFDDGITYTGRYTYTNTGPNTARFVNDYDDGDRCTSILTFTSATTGTSTFTCTGGPPSSSSWRLV